jgi:hypothetical protein
MAWGPLHTVISPLVSRHPPLLHNFFRLRRLPFQLSTLEGRLLRKSFVCRFTVRFGCKSFIYRFYAFQPGGVWHTDSAGSGWEAPYFPTFRRSDLSPSDLFFSSPFVADEVGNDLGDAGELVGAKLGIHGEGEDFFGGAFGVREGTGFVS